MLGRPADDGGKLHYARLLALGERTEQQIRHELEQSDEFRAGTGLARKAVRAVMGLRYG